MKNNEIRTFEMACRAFKVEQELNGKTSPTFIGVAYEQEELNPQVSEEFYHYMDQWQSEQLVLCLTQEVARLIDQYEGELETVEQVKRFLMAQKLKVETFSDRELGAIKVYALSKKLQLHLVRILEEK